MWLGRGYFIVRGYLKIERNLIRYYFVVICFNWSYFIEGEIEVRIIFRRSRINNHRFYRIRKTKFLLLWSGRLRSFFKRLGRFGS